MSSIFQPPLQLPKILNQAYPTFAMSTPTSVPKRSPADKEGKLKLRASCDACAASKVKCSKEQPICARCAANGSLCVYGISRKHGKPGRTRKRNPDGTAFIKASKQRPSPNGSEFGKFRIRPEPFMAPLADMETLSNWSSTPSLRSTPDFELEMTPEPFYLDSANPAFMDDIFLPTAQLEPKPMQTIESELMFSNPFAKRQSILLNHPDLQALKDYIGGDSVNPLDYTYQEMPVMTSYEYLPPSKSPQSPLSNPVYGRNPMRVSMSMPTSHCCYTLAYSTLESLRIISAHTTEAHPILELKSFDSVLSTTKLAVQSVLQLLDCPCSSDPHLAMLYSSITSKILTWYQIAAGVNVTESSSRSTPFSNGSSSSSVSSSVLSSRQPTPMSEDNMGFHVHMQPLHFGQYQFDERAHEKLRRQAVLRELQKCGPLIEALANWTSDGQAYEQAEFLYDVLGAWLKSEMYKIVREIENVNAL